MLLLGCLSIAVASPSLRLEEMLVDSKMDEQNLWDFIENVYNNYKIIINGVVIALGLFLCFLGKKSVKFNMFVCGLLAGGIPTFVLATDLLNGSMAEKQAFWISIGSSCVMGIIVGILLVCLFQIGYFVIGAAFGAVVAVYSDVILDSIIRFHSDVVLYVAIGAFALEFGLFAMVWDNIVVILGTSLIGSYIMTFGLGQFLGNWINPFSPHFTKHLMNPPVEWYIYLGIIAAFTIFGVVVQAVTNKAPKEEKTVEAPLLSISDNTPAKFSKGDASTRKTERSLTLREMKDQTM
ncbi:hypothetical protein WA556_004493 [Blastocystis sp. ATCC 50177/Nand II]